MSPSNSKGLLDESQEAENPRGKMTVNITNIKDEILVFLRNQDILTTTQRGVTTANATGTLSGTKVITISRTNVKNIRTITVAAVSKSLGTDYTVNYNHANGCVITFESNQTGDYVVSYDYGTGSIFPDFPRNDLNINSYPRIAVDIQNVDTDANGIGGESFISNIGFTIVVYADSTSEIDGYIQAIKDAMRTNAKLFYYINFIKPTITSPLITSPDRRDEIMQRSTDFLAMFQQEG